MPPVFQMLACKRGSTMVGYSSLALLAAIAAITLLGHADSDTDGVTGSVTGGAPPHQRAGGAASSH